MSMCSFLIADICIVLVDVLTLLFMFRSGDYEHLLDDMSIFAFAIANNRPICLFIPKIISTFAAHF